MNSKFDRLAIASVQAGHRIASVNEPIVDPHKLHIVAFYVQKTEDTKEQLLLHTEDISEVTSRGLIIDHDEQLMSNDGDLVRLQEIIDLDFRLLNKPVETEGGAKVGSVSRFAIDTHTFMIMQIYVTQPVTLNFGNAEVIIHRSQIINVTEKKIIVKDASVKKTAKFSFRNFLFGRQAEPKPEPERIKIDKN